MELTIQAAMLGTAAHKTGKFRVPALDAALKPVISAASKLGSKTVIAVLDAWLRAWDRENLR